MDAGRNTLSSTSVIARIGRSNSFIASVAACFGSIPFSTYLAEPSTTMIASSTTMPMARTRANRVSRLTLKSERGHRREGADDGDGHRRRRHQRRPPALQEHDDDEEDEHRRLDQRLVDLFDGGAHEARGVERHRIRDPAGEGGREPLHLGFDGLADIERIGIRQLKDGDARGRLAVHVEKLAVGLGAELDAADVADAGHRAAGVALGLDRDLLELRHGGEPPAQVERELERLIVPGPEARRSARPRPPGSAA